MGSCQRGNASDKTGSNSALMSASVQMRCREAADARASAIVATAAAASTTVTFNMMSTAGSQAAFELIADNWDKNSARLIAKAPN